MVRRARRGHGTASRAYIAVASLRRASLSLSDVSPVPPAATRTRGARRQPDEIAVTPRAVAHPRSRARSLVRAGALTALFLGTAEATARVTDWLRDGTPLTATPDFDRDLTVFDGRSVRGRPFGRYQHWRLNTYGFRGPDRMAPLPDERSCRGGRVMTLGGSETLGLYERDDREYPAQLRNALAADNVEVVNAGIANLSLRGVISFWDAWGSRFRPAAVSIYAAPTFYLGDSLPDWRRRGSPSPEAPEAAPPPRFVPRLLARVQDQTRGLTWINHWRHARTLRARTAGRPPSWFFPDVPASRVAAYTADLDSVVSAVRAAGAVPVLVVPASPFTLPLRRADAPWISAALLRTPRVRPEGFVRFTAAAADSVRAVAARRGAPLVDLGRDVTGRRALFADAVHYTDQGAAAVAGRLAPALRAAARRCLTPAR